MKYRNENYNNPVVKRHDYFDVGCALEACRVAVNKAQYRYDLKKRCYICVYKLLLLSCRVPNNKTDLGVR